MTRYRPGTPADSRTCFDIFERTIDDLGRRTGGGANATADDPAAWDIRRPLFDHLANTGDAWWIAEDEVTGNAIGYARSILRDGVRELTEFFVLPETQSGGVGRELLARAFPAEGARYRATVATLDPRAIARYLRTGLDARAPMIGLHGVPRNAPVATDLAREPIDPATPPLDELAQIDGVVSTSGATPTMPGSPASVRAGYTAAKAERWRTAINRLGQPGAVHTRRSRQPICRPCWPTARRRPPRPGTTTSRSTSP